jgi:putative intracellular protease/amidase
MPLAPAAHRDDSVGMRVEIVVFDGFDELDAFGPFEVLALAGFDVELVVAGEPGLVRNMRGIEMAVPRVLGRPDGVVVVGGGWMNRAERGAWAEARRGLLPARLADVAGIGGPEPPGAGADGVRWMASVCTGAMLLASAGLLKGRTATTNRSAYDELRAYDVNVLEQRVVDDGDRITAGALSAGIDLGLWITEREMGAARKAAVAAAIR